MLSSVLGEARNEPRSRNLRQSDSGEEAQTEATAKEPVPRENQRREK